MSGRWFRMYDEILDDPKIQLLEPELFRMWVNLLALCSRNNGKLPPLKDIAFALRETEQSVSSAFHMLSDVGLIVTDGETFQPYNWKKRQYKSDTSTIRVQEHRKRFRNVSETPRARSETDTDKKEELMPDKSGAYAFCGKTIKLTPPHLREWNRLFHSIGDVEAELSVLDEWWQSQPKAKRGNWFLATKGMLNKKHQQHLAAEKAARAPPPWDGMP